MQKTLTLAALSLAALVGAAGTAPANDHVVWPTQAAFPTLNPPGYYTNRYYYQWYMPWFAYYNYSASPYAGWGERASYGVRVYNVVQPSAQAAPAAAPAPAAAAAEAPATLTVSLPADGKLLFNGTAADGAGESRTFRTPPLRPGQDYAYELTVEVVRNGEVVTASERVTVRAGGRTAVAIQPAQAVAAAK